MRQTSLSYRSKPVILGTGLTSGTMLLFGAAVWWQNVEAHQAAVEGSQSLARADLDHIVQNVYKLCETA
jgi:hypothetical protein